MHQHHALQHMADLATPHKLDGRMAERGARDRKGGAQGMRSRCWPRFCGRFDRPLAPVDVRGTGSDPERDCSSRRFASLALHNIRRPPPRKSRASESSSRAYSMDSFAFRKRGPGRPGASVRSRSAPMGVERPEPRRYTTGITEGPWVNGSLSPSPADSRDARRSERADCAGWMMSLNGRHPMPRRRCMR